MSDCIFCEKLQTHDGYIGENELAFLFWDQYPVNKGHILVCPKRHVQDYFQLTNCELLAIKELLYESKTYLKYSFGADGFNIGINVGEHAGQTVNHVHVHLIPRYKGDVENPKGGIRNFKKAVVPFGCLVKERMELLDMDINSLSDETFVEIETLENIIEEKISLKDIEEFDMNMIASALYCTPEYFIDESIREKDIINNSLNRRADNSVSILMKGKIQNFVRDFIFIQGITQEG